MDKLVESTGAKGGNTKWLLSRLGPGLIAGASDDDPSGVGTFSQVGARFGYQLLWSCLLCVPLMIAVQQISAIIGRTTGHGLSGNIRKHYSPWLLYPAVFLLTLANTFNVGADLGAMGDASRMLLGGPAMLYVVLFATACVVFPIWFSYKHYSSLLKWTTLVLFAYVGTAFTAHVAWKTALLRTVLPSIHLSKEYVAAFLAILGTTLSPYMFFWQAAQETEEIGSEPDEQPLKHAPEQAPIQLERIRFDTYVGMLLSQIVSFSMLLAAAAALHTHGILNVETSTQAAQALRPFAGKFAFILFALGIVGTGMLSTPVLAASSAYAIAGTFRLRQGLDERFSRAMGFYGVLAAGVLLGVLINVPSVGHHLGLTPIRALFLSAVLNGVVAGPLLVVMMVMASNPRVMGQLTISRPLRITGWITAAIMVAAAVAMFFV